MVEWCFLQRAGFCERRQSLGGAYCRVTTAVSDLYRAYGLHKAGVRTVINIVIM
jgi:hypothetical protein